MHSRKVPDPLLTPGSRKPLKSRFAGQKLLHHALLDRELLGDLLLKRLDETVNIGKSRGNLDLLVS